MPIEQPGLRQHERPRADGNEPGSPCPSCENGVQHPLTDLLAAVLDPRDDDCVGANDVVDLNLVARFVLRRLDMPEHLAGDTQVEGDDAVQCENGQGVQRDFLSEEGDGSAIE